MLTLDSLSLSLSLLLWLSSFFTSSIQHIVKFIKFKTISSNPYINLCESSKKKKKKKKRSRRRWRKRATTTGYGSSTGRSSGYSCSTRRSIDSAQQMKETEVLPWRFAFVVTMWASTLTIEAQPWKFCGGQERRELRNERECKEKREIRGTVRTNKVNNNNN